MARRKQKNKNKQSQVFSAADAAKKVRAIERVKNGSSSSGATQYHTYTEASRTSDNYISDETSIADPNVTLPFYEKYHDEKLKNIAVEIESRSSEKIHEIKEHITAKISANKTEMLLWMVGTIIVISIGLIGFHFTSISKISENLDSRFEQNFTEIKDKIMRLEDAINQIKSENAQPGASLDAKQRRQ